MIDTNFSDLKSGEFNRHSANQASIRIVLACVIFSAIWILFSDQAVAMVVGYPSDPAFINTLKGWLFVAVTSFVLAVVVRRYVSRLAISADQFRKSEHYLKNIINTVGDPVFVKDNGAGFLLPMMRFARSLKLPGRI